MSNRGDGEQVYGFDQLAATLEQAQLLGQHVLEVAQNISDASLAALEKANPAIIDTPLAQEWPLAYKFGMLQLVGSQAVTLVKKVGQPFVYADSPLIAMPLTRDKYNDHDLERAYTGPDKREAFAQDMVKWAAELSAAGWPVIADVNIPEDDKITVHIYQDDEETRSRVTANSATTHNPAEEVPHDVWVSERVVISGNEVLGAKLQATQ